MQSGVCLKGHQNPEGQNYCGICGQILPREGVEIEGPDQFQLEKRGPRAPARWLVLLILIGVIGTATVVQANKAATTEAPRPRASSPTATPTGFIPAWPGIDVNDLVPGVDPIAPGQAALVSDQWRVRVSGVNRDASEDVESVNYLNGPPQIGFQYVLVRVNIQYVGEVPRAPSSDLVFGLVTTSGLRSLADVVGPSDLESIGELFPRGDAEADLIFEVMPSQTGALLLTVSDDTNPDVRQFLAL